MLHKNRLKMQALGLLLVSCSVILLGLGGLSLIEYGVPMALGKYNQASERLSIGSRGQALYNDALASLKQYQWQGAAKSCDSAFASVCDERGQVVAGQERLAAEAQLVLGICLVEKNKHEQALVAYDRFLALVPDPVTKREHNVVKAARRTREWLRQSIKSNGKSAQPKPDAEQQATKQRRSGRI